MLIRLSVITVSYNAAATIEDTIKSVLGQSYQNTEYIVVDGGSSDDTVNILERYDASLSRWVSEPDEGLYDAMNKGLAMATGDYVGFLNADDFFAHPNALTAIADRLNNTKADMTFGNCLIVDARNTNETVRFYNSWRFRPWHMRFGNMPPHASVYVRRDLLLAEKGFRTDLKIAADFDLLVRLILKRQSSLAYVPGITSINRSGGVSTQGLKSTIRINREIGASLRRNDIKSNTLFLWSRYLTKIWQYFRKGGAERTIAPGWFEATP